MSLKPKILAFAGSARKDSFNKRLLSIAVVGAQKAGAEVTVIDLKNYPIPIFDQDLEAQEGLPVHAKQIKDLMVAHDGFLLACPEYNSSITPLLKNVFDWASRSTEKNETPLKAYQGKVASIMSASPGALGGLRGLTVVRSLLENMGVIVLPKQKAVSKASEAFAENGQLKDDRQQKDIEALGQQLADTILKLKS